MINYDNCLFDLKYVFLYNCITLYNKCTNIFLTTNEQSDKTYRIIQLQTLKNYNLLVFKYNFTPHE